MQLPNVTFRLTPIETSRGVAPVPLAWDLERLQRRWNAEAENRLSRGASTSRPGGHDVDECASGFLTLDAAKRLVPIADVDPRAVEVPVVGVWYTGAAVPAHLGVWSAMLRFAAHDGFKRKATMGVPRGCRGGCRGGCRRRIVLAGDVPTSIAHGDEVRPGETRRVRRGDNSGDEAVLEVFVRPAGAMRAG